MQRRPFNFVIETDAKRKRAKWKDPAFRSE